MPSARFCSHLSCFEVVLSRWPGRVCSVPTPQKKEIFKAVPPRNASFGDEMARNPQKIPGCTAFGAGPALWPHNQASAPGAHIYLRSAPCPVSLAVPVGLCAAQRTVMPRPLHCIYWKPFWRMGALPMHGLVHLALPCAHISFLSWSHRDVHHHVAPHCAVDRCSLGRCPEHSVRECGHVPAASLPDGFVHWRPLHLHA
jgi:hypothetical protein